MEDFQDQTLLQMAILFRKNLREEWKLPTELHSSTWTSVPERIPKKYGFENWQMDQTFQTFFKLFDFWLLLKSLQCVSEQGPRHMWVRICRLLSMHQVCIFDVLVPRGCNIHGLLITLTLSCGGCCILWVRPRTASGSREWFIGRRKRGLLID